jgi:hypothetical protein
MMGIAEIEISTRIGHNRAARMSGRFLKGPVPMPTISQASRLGGRALAVYLAIHHQTALTGKATITLPRSLLESMGIDKDAKARALHSLEAAAVITIDQAKGRAARVSLVQALTPSGTEK